MKPALIVFCVILPLCLGSQGAVSLPPVTVHSPRVANQVPVGTFAMPVSALRYEPGVDLQARNLAEGQADVTIRGGIFESTGLRLGAVSVPDPQTGHYLAEVPVAPAMLGAPEILTGVPLATQATNATAGAIHHAWRRISPGGVLSAGGGEHGLRRGEIHFGHVSEVAIAGRRLAADVALAHSRSDGSVPMGDHRFDRSNLRLQLVDASAQTDLFAGYQAKFFGWPNLYTPFNSPESEDLETVLFALNHRVDWGAGDYLEAGTFHRRNKDDYAFNRLAPVGPIHPFQHTTWLTGGALSARLTRAGLAWHFRAELLADRLRSTSLTFGRFNSRTLTKIALVPEWSGQADGGGRLLARIGATVDDSNRGPAAVSPVLEVAREWSGGSRWRRLYASYAEATQVPTYTALNSSAAAGLFRGNPNLGRSRSRGLEVGASGEVRAWSVQAAAFWRREESLVDWTFRRGVTARTANAVDLAVGGVEVFGRRAWPAADLLLGWTMIAKEADYRGAAVDASFYALNYARQRLTAAVILRLGRGLELRMDNVARVQADNALRVVGGDEAITSALGLAFRPRGWRGWEFHLQVENLWDTDFQAVPAVPAARRQAAVSSTFAW